MKTKELTSTEIEIIKNNIEYFGGVHILAEIIGVDDSEITLLLKSSNEISTCDYKRYIKALTDESRKSIFKLINNNINNKREQSLEKYRMHQVDKIELNEFKTMINDDKYQNLSCLLFYKHSIRNLKFLDELKEHIINYKNKNNNDYYELAAKMKQFSMIWKLFRPSRIIPKAPYWGTQLIMDHVYQFLYQLMGIESTNHFSDSFFSSSNYDTYVQQHYISISSSHPIQQKWPIEKEHINWENLEKDIQFITERIKETIYFSAFELISSYHNCVSDFIVQLAKEGIHFFRNDLNNIDFKYCKECRQFTYKNGSISISNAYIFMEEIKNISIN